MVKIAVLGYGTVGSGVVEVLNINRDTIDNNAGQPIRVKYILDLRDFPNDPIASLVVHDFDTILKDDEVKIVVEVMGGFEPAHTYVKEALEHGKHVCTSNKALVAKYGNELLRIARENNVSFLFEASVGGGIPLIRPLNHAMTADVFSNITGILNGTTNYILTKMARDGVGFDVALKEAQELGYAERDPSADVDGDDARRKLAILSSIAYENYIDYEDIYTEGIRAINERDILYAKHLGYSIKLIAYSRNNIDETYCIVAPFLLASDNPLYHVVDVFNAVLIHGNAVNDVMFYGSGAGKLPTASAVVSDIVDIAMGWDRSIKIRWNTEKKCELTSVENLSLQRLLRFNLADLSSVEETIKKYTKDYQIIKIDNEDIAILTNNMTESAVRQLQGEIPQLVSHLRVHSR